MVLPWMIGAAVAATAGKAISETFKKKEAEKIIENSKAIHQSKVDELRNEEKITNETIQNYLQLHREVYTNQVQKALILLKGQKTFTNHQSQKVKSIKFSTSSYKTSNNNQTGINNRGIKSGFGLDTTATFVGGTAAILVGKGALSFAKNFGVASTGTAISSLSGAARDNAGLAFLGGGSKESGGGGMELGSLVVAGLALGTFAVVGSYFLSSEGEEALNQARAFENNVNNSIVEIDKLIDFLKQLQQHVYNLTQLIRNLENSIIRSLNTLESRTVDEAIETAAIKKIKLLVKALEKVRLTPLLNCRGQLNPKSQELLYPDLLKRVEKELIRRKALVNIGQTLAALTILSLGSWMGSTRWKQEQQWTEVEAVMENVLNSESQTDQASLENFKQELQRTITVFEPVASFPGCQLLQSQISISENTANLLGCRSFAIDRLRVGLGTVEQQLQSNSKVENQLKSAQKLAMEAAIIVQNPPHPVQVWQEAQIKWEEAIQLLSEISHQDLMQDEIQQTLKTYQNNYQIITARAVQEESASNNWGKALQLGQETAEMVQNSPHPLLTWREAHSKCNEAVKLLNSIPSTTSIYHQAQEKVVGYKNNCANLDKRVGIEEKAVNTMMRVEKLDREIQTAAQEMPYTASTLQQMLFKTNQVINLLYQIPSGTIVSEKAETLKAAYQYNQKEISEKIENLEDCQTISSGVCIDSTFPINLKNH